jgi:hypothetical protein
VVLKGLSISSKDLSSL